MNDGEYVAAIKKIRLEYTPQTYETLGATILEATRTSPAVLARYKKITGEGGDPNRRRHHLTGFLNQAASDWTTEARIRFP